MRTEAFEPAPDWTAEQLAVEGMTAQRWWMRSELAAATEIFAPRRLPVLLEDLLESGPSAEPSDVGV